MKRLLIMAGLILSLVACKDSGNKQAEEGQNQTSSEINTNEENQANGNYGLADTNDTPDGTVTSSDAIQSSSGTTNNTMAGRFIKKDHSEDSDCSCYCVDINLSGTSELCLSENKLYINARMEKSGNKINVYYDGKSAKTNNTKIPWDKFDKTVSIAEITTEADGGLKLDWKGFTIDGDIAVDYAIYGKKTLEGTYKKL